MAARGSAMSRRRAVFAGTANLHLVSLELSMRRCAGCWLPIAQALVDAEPDTHTHPCCGEAAPLTWVVDRMRRAPA